MSEFVCNINMVKDLVVALSSSKLLPLKCFKAAVGRLVCKLGLHISQVLV